MKTERGDTEAQTVQPGRTAYFSLRVHKKPKPKSTNKGVIAAYKFIDGLGYYSEFAPNRISTRR